jgi:hypothetical protein
VAAGAVLTAHDGNGWGEPVPLGARGRVRALAADQSGIWLAHDGGASHWDPTGREWWHYLVPQDVPLGPVLDVLPAGDHLWLATPVGAVRLDTRHR